MVKNGQQYSVSWETTHQQQQQHVDYYMNQTPVPTVPSNEFNSTTVKEIYPWMSEKKHGNNKTKNSSPGKLFLKN
jgi:hypothetical protein